MIIVTRAARFTLYYLSLIILPFLELGRLEGANECGAKGINSAAEVAFALQVPRTLLFASYRLPARLCS